MPASLQLTELVEELTLIRCSLLPGERLVFLDITRPDIHPSLWNSPISDDNSQAESQLWDKLVTAGSSSDDIAVVVRHDQLRRTGTDNMALTPARFRLVVDGARVSFEVDCQRYDGECESVNDCIGIKGDNLTRMRQEWWKERIKEGLEEIIREAGGDKSGYPLYQILSSYLLPLLHDKSAQEEQKGTEKPCQGNQQPSPHANEVYHALFTLHHLISSTKRRNLQSWSSALNIVGFAKVGYPGVIYTQGLKDDIEEFVANVKAMQWLALKLRFVEPLESIDGGEERKEELRGWREFEKVGEVVEEMKSLGRGRYMVEMGIGGGRE